MASDRWQQVDAILQDALERAPSERSAFLRDACIGDPDLQRQVESLLDAHERAGSFLESPAMTRPRLGDEGQRPRGIDGAKPDSRSRNGRSWR